MRWTPEEYEDYQRRRASAGAKGLRSTDQKPAKGNPLERAPHREKKSSVPPSGCAPHRGRARIVFRVFSVRPADWDGYHIKELQDLLIHAGILVGDEWYKLEGSVISEKVHEKEEEKTLIEITYS